MTGTVREFLPSINVYKLPDSIFNQQQEEDEDYSYSDSWKDDDYFRDFKDSWDRQAKELPDTLAEPDMLSSWSDNVAQRVKLIN